MMQIDNTWFIKAKFYPQAKFVEMKRKYCEKVEKKTSKNDFNSEFEKIIENLSKILHETQTFSLIDFEKNKKECNHLLKIKDSFKGVDLALCIAIKKSKLGKIKISVRMKKGDVEKIGTDIEEITAFIKREILLIFVC